MTERIHFTAGSPDKPGSAVRHTFNYQSCFIHLESCFEQHGFSCSKYWFAIMKVKGICLKIGDAHTFVFRQLQSWKSPQYSLNESKKQKTKSLPSFMVHFLLVLNQKVQKCLIFGKWYLRKRKFDHYFRKRESQILESMISAIFPALVF